MYLTYEYIAPPVDPDTTTVDFRDRRSSFELRGQLIINYVFGDYTATYPQSDSL